MSKIKDIKEWKELFETHILTRGYYYAQEDRVWDIGHEKDVVSAVVAGTEDYLVRNVDEAEWLSFRENILQSEKDTDIRLELLKQEELLDRLMEEVKSRNSIASLVENKRIGGKVVQTVKANLGPVTEDQIPYLKAAYARKKPRLVYDDE